jgi:hypothetical protein
MKMEYWKEELLTATGWKQEPPKRQALPSGAEQSCHPVRFLYFKHPDLLGRIDLRL